MNQVHFKVPADDIETCVVYLQSIAVDGSHNCPTKISSPNEEILRRMAKPDENWKVVWQRLQPMLKLIDRKVGSKAAKPKVTELDGTLDVKANR